ncbi:MULTISPECIES: single-stranded DNA-binding protein [Sporosarcina]|uniref:Single-stranded DNA-binding protein n=1 Tax=Sporosarcina saromensis TaxID=359365 RepID=A0ABU4GCL8_9BACL|nr:single-stranded DNA-binding protein [Sporosarcina saromensis]MDW0114055.1 single-stranded DNA-binding protein [Sporosarcina saromensis]
MNQVALVGRITKDPVLRRLSEGRFQTSFILAVNRKFKNQQGEVDADFILCTTWGRVAENTAKHCGKGSLIGVGGRIQSRTYEREDKSRVFITEVIGDEVRFLATKRRTSDDLYDDTEANVHSADSPGRDEEQENVSANFQLPQEEKDGLPIY